MGTQTETAAARAKAWLPRLMPLLLLVATELAAQHAPILPAPSGTNEAPRQSQPEHAPPTVDRNLGATAATHNAKPELPPLVAWNWVRRGNAKFVQQRLAAAALAASQMPELHDSQPHGSGQHGTGQHGSHAASPHATATATRPSGAGKYVCAVITCADADHNIAELMGLAQQDVLVLRLAGTFVNPEAVALLDRIIEQHQLSLIILLSHEQCESLRSSQTNANDALDRRLTQLRPLAKRQQQSLSEAVVRQQRELLLASSASMQKLVQQDRLRVLPAVLNDKSGAVQWHHRRAQELPLSPVK